MENLRFGELQWPPNLRLDHCEVSKNLFSFSPENHCPGVEWKRQFNFVVLQPDSVCVGSVSPDLCYIEVKDCIANIGLQANWQKSLFCQQYGLDGPHFHGHNETIYQTLKNQISLLKILQVVKVCVSYKLSLVPCGQIDDWGLKVFF